MTGYIRTNQKGKYDVYWQPDDSQAALQSLVHVDGTGISSESDLPDDGLVDLDGQPDVQQAVRNKYNELTA